MEKVNNSNDAFQSVSQAYGEGNSDKLCDFIADSILDFCLEQDPEAKVQIVVSTKSNLITILGEIEFSPDKSLDVEQIVRDCCKDIGYDHADKGLDAK